MQRKTTLTITALVLFFLISTSGISQSGVLKGAECIRQLPKVQQEFFKDCTLLDALDPSQIRDALNNGKPILIPVAGKVFSLSLKLDDTIFAKDAVKGKEDSKGGVDRKIAKSNTYTGKVLELPNSVAITTISENDRYIYGFGYAGSKSADQFFFETVVEPQRRLFRVVTYRGSDVRLKFCFPDDDASEKSQGLRCKPSIAVQTSSNSKNRLSSNAANLNSTHIPQRIFGLGDQSFVNSFWVEGTTAGSATVAAFARMEYLIAMIKVWYALPSTNVLFEISELWLHLYNFSVTDPYELRENFKTHMEPPNPPGSFHHNFSSEPHYHVAHLFTGLDMGGYTGLSEGAGGHYTWSQMLPIPDFYGATAFDQGIAAAHEIGHNYKATHKQCSPLPIPDIMCAGTIDGPDTRVTSFSPENAKLIDEEEAVKSTR